MFRDLVQVWPLEKNEERTPWTSTVLKESFGKDSGEAFKLKVYSRGLWVVAWTISTWDFCWWCWLHLATAQVKLWMCYKKRWWMGPEECEWSCQSHPYSKRCKWLVSMATTASMDTFPIFTGPWRQFDGNIFCGNATSFLGIVHLWVISAWPLYSGESDEDINN